jgi:hypothetical protein
VETTIWHAQANIPTGEVKEREDQEEVGYEEYYRNTVRNNISHQVFQVLWEKWTH